MNTKTTLVAQIQEKFEGGASFSLNWDYVLKEGAQAMLQNISPKSLIFKTSIYGGFIDDNFVYYCPSDVGAPLGIFDKLKRLKFDYVAPRIFEELTARGTSQKLFTIETINGEKFIMINSKEATGILVVNDFDDASEITNGNVTVATNTYDYVSGSSSIQGTFTDTLNEIGADFDTAQDITDFLYGVGIVRMKLTDETNISSIKLILKTTDANYWTITATTAMDYLIKGWNTVRFSISDRVATGSPVATNITEWALQITMETGETQLIILDQLTLCSSSMYNFKYASNKIFLDHATLERKNETDNVGDLINLEDDEYEIYKYECCRIVCQQSTTANAKSIETSKFDSELGRKYSLYFAKNPSNEMPISYNQSPDIAQSQDFVSSYNSRGELTDIN